MFPGHEKGVRAHRDSRSGGDRLGGHVTDLHLRSDRRAIDLVAPQEHVPEESECVLVLAPADHELAVAERGQAGAPGEGADPEGRLEARGGAAPCGDEP